MFVLLKGSVGILTSIFLGKNLGESIPFISKDNFVCFGIQAPRIMQSKTWHYKIKFLSCFELISVPFSL